MACNSCETTFQGAQTLVVVVAKSGSSAVLSIATGSQHRANQSHLTVRVGTLGHKRITATYYILNGLAAGSIVQAQAEYVEIEGRSRSCPTTM